MREKRLVGLDIGTSGLKATLADLDGNITDHLKQDYNLVEAAPGVVPLRVYETAVKEVLESLAKRYQLTAIAVTTQMYSICRKTPDGPVALQWNSLFNRTADRESGFRQALLNSGCPVDTLYGGYKLFASGHEERQSFLLYGIKEHIIQMLTGELATDYTTASASGLFDLRSKDWNRPQLARMGMDAAGLPRLVQHNRPAGNLRPGAFSGADTATVVAPGLGDGPSASYACRDVSDSCGNVGTSTACRIFTDSPDLERTDSMWIYLVDDRMYIAGGISSNGCTVFHWANRLGFETIDELRETGDLMLLPWIYGERMPYWSSDLQGVLLGLRANTTKEDISCAVQKAVAFTLTTMVRQLEPLGKPSDPLVLAGGGINSQGVLQALAGSIGSDIAILQNSDHLCSTGAVMSAGESVGITVRPANNLCRTLQASSTYKREYERWRAAGKAMAAFYQALEN